ncbi:MAG: LysM peptidoglycan-binding domain-containing protein [Candidatus Accumulibacter sp.]|jgi:membrane-bound lytic murein transglycosylase D|nr:LysM peptidoglycan-binding domain-containing protein [Accumulibacter sp.]
MAKRRDFPRTRLVRMICSALLLTGCVSVAPPPGQHSPAPRGDIPLEPRDDAIAVASERDRRPVPEIALTPVDLPEAPPAPPAIDLTHSPDDLFERIRRGFAMPELNDDLVRQHQQWYLDRPDYLRRMVERSGRYLYHIVEELDKRGLPMELALLPMVESAYNPLAYSRSKASGLWQFIPSTGRRYNLDQDWWKDERRDVVASTAAALEYLQLIYDLHGDWHLALASYNWGEGAVGRALEKNQAQGLPADYLSLSMPNETRNYIPKLQALKNIFRDPALMAELELPRVPNQPYFTTFTTDAHIDVKLAAKLAEMPVEEFAALNPAPKRPVIEPDTSLVIPAEKLETFVSNLEAHSDENKPLSSWRTYTLRPGDRLEKIASRFGTTVAGLRAANGLNGKSRISPGQTLLVPGPEQGKSAKASRPAAKARAAVAGKASPKPDAPSQTASARKQTEKQAGKPAPATPRVTRYTVRRGDTIYSIARQFKVAEKDLMRLNRVNPKTLRIGSKLTIQLARNS